MSTIPASHFVSVTPSVLAAGGAALDMNALMITKSSRVPIGTVAQFTTAAAVASYFGPGSNEANAATIYFNGFDISTKKPGVLLVAQKNGGNVAAYLRGGNVSGYSLSQLQALSGTIILTVNGVLFTSSTINLSSATSFSNAATIIQAGFTSPTFTVTYDSISGGFVFTSSTTGPSSTITFATGTLSGAAGLSLTASSGAVTSQGAAPASNEVQFMNGIIAITTNWVTFFTNYDPDQGSGNTDKMNFASWANSQGNRYAYVAWDQDATPTTTVPATTSMGYLLAQSGSSSTALVYGTDYTKAAFICGCAASLDFNRTNGRDTFAFLNQSGLSPDVTDVTTASNLESNGYNYYGIAANAKQQWQFLYPGSISGKFLWLDSWISQVWLNSSLQGALMNFLLQIGSIPYNSDGYALVRQACMGPITAALNFGAIRKGVTLSTAQIAEINNAVGTGANAAAVVSSQGFYLQIQDAAPSVRAARGSPPITLFYADGQSIQNINIASIAVQ